MDLIFELVAELMLQFVGEALADLLAIRRTRVVSVVAGSLLAAILAVAFAGITIAFHPDPIITESGPRLAALIILPLVNGLVVTWIGRKLAAAGKHRSGFEYFVPAFTFSLIFGVTRFFAQR